MMNETTNVILAGVGGQGVILVGELLALGAVNAGHDVKQTEVHGLGQRGGSVHSHVRFGGVVHSPLIKPGQADVLIATEKLEGLRFAHNVRAGGVIVINTHELPPIGSRDHYPHEAVGFLRGKGFRVLAFDATERALALGNPRVSNVLLLGAASPYLGIPGKIWRATLQAQLPARILEINQRAFAEGMQVTKEEAMS
jgi:indolepyruvate ferredoxin oxidoreductase beta subunit